MLDKVKVFLSFATGASLDEAEEERQMRRIGKALTVEETLLLASGMDLKAIRSRKSNPVFMDVILFVNSFHTLPSSFTSQKLFLFIYYHYFFYFFFVFFCFLFKDHLSGKMMISVRMFNSFRILDQNRKKKKKKWGYKKKLKAINTRNLLGKSIKSGRKKEELVECVIG